MHLQEAIKNVFIQLSETLLQLTPQQYVQPVTTLFNATIGQHVRHIIELFIELDKGYLTGIVNYDKRKRDFRIETDIHFANETLSRLQGFLNKPDKPLALEQDYSENLPGLLVVATNYHRELIYNLEHAIHHMAFIRIGINEVAAITIPENFGIAISTIKHRTACAQ